MNKCLCCYKPLEEGQVDFHPACARKLFGRSLAPVVPYTRDNMSELAKKVIRTSASVTGVQAKMSLGLDRGKRNEPDKLTIVGLCGRYILKPQSPKYRCLPELEDVTMKMAQAAGIETATHSLIRLSDGELSYITLRMDRTKDGRKVSMLDMCQLSNRISEHKYLGAYQQLAGTIKRYSAASMLDVQRFWEVVLFSWITGNSDMHCKNFSLIEKYENEYVLAPSYDLLAVLLVDPNDTDELAMALEVGGKKAGFDRGAFMSSIIDSGVTEKAGEKIIKKMISNAQKWYDILDSSFLPEDMIAAYKKLIVKRIEVLRQAPS